MLPHTAPRPCSVAWVAIEAITWCCWVLCSSTVVDEQAGMGGHRHKGVDLMRVFSIQGYCLLPITAVAAVGIVFDLRCVPWPLFFVFIACSVCACRWC